MPQLYKSVQSLYHITNCCLMFVSSWLEKPKQIRHQSSEALNCDLFCQSCENKGCIKCPATTVIWFQCQRKWMLQAAHLFTWRCSYGPFLCVCVVRCECSMLHLLVIQTGAVFLEADHHEASNPRSSIYQCWLQPQLQGCSSAVLLTARLLSPEVSLHPRHPG